MFSLLQTFSQAEIITSQGIESGRHVCPTIVTRGNHQKRKARRINQRVGLMAVSHGGSSLVPGGGGGGEVDRHAYAGVKVLSPKACCSPHT